MAIARPTDAGIEVRVGEQVRRVDAGRQDLKEFVLMGGDRHEAVGGREHAERTQERMVVALGPGPQPLHGMLPHHALTHGEYRVNHGHVDKLAHAGASGVMYGGQHAKPQHDARHDVADPRAHLGGGRGIGSGYRHDAAHGLGNDVVCRPVLVGGVACAPIAKATQCAVDQARIDLAKRFVAQSEPVHDARAEVLRHGVGRFHKVLEDPFAFFGLQIETDASLVAVDALEVAAERLDVVAVAVRAGRARDVTVQPLDLDHLRTVVSEHHRAVGPREHLREVDDPDIAQRSKRARYVGRESGRFGGHG